MARSLAYRDGSMAHLLAYRRRLKWLARSHIATRRLNGALVRISTTAQMARSLAYSISISINIRISISISISISITSLCSK
jgi:hypothetical protein